MTGILREARPCIGVLKRISLSPNEASIRPPKARLNTHLSLRKAGKAVNSDTNLIKGGTEIFKHKIKAQKEDIGPLRVNSPDLKRRDRLLTYL